jgi:protein phosphatase methylesterase 1
VRTCPALLKHSYKICGVAVLDVVEGILFALLLQALQPFGTVGTAIEALPLMNSLLNARPDGFDSAEEAIEWQYVTRLNTNSLPAPTHIFFVSVATNTILNPNSARVSIPSIITPSESTSPIVPKYVWRTPLRSTAPYWSGA